MADEFTIYVGNRYISRLTRLLLPKINAASPNRFMLCYTQTLFLDYPT